METVNLKCNGLPLHTSLASFALSVQLGEIHPPKNDGKRKARDRSFEEYVGDMDLQPATIHNRAEMVLAAFDEGQTISRIANYRRELKVASRGRISR